MQGTGQVRYGKPGQIHADLMTPEDDHLMFGINPSDMGFAVPGGPFMSRQHAAEFVKSNEPARTAYLHAPTGLQSEQYNRKAGGRLKGENDKAVRSALMVARRQRAPGGSLSDAISSFSKDREAQFNRPSGNSDAALLAALQSQHPQLAVAEPPEQRKQSQASGVADLGAQIDEGAKWLSGTPDDDTDAPAKGGPSNRIGAPAGMGASINSQPAHPGGPSHSNVDQNSAAMHMMDRLINQHGWTPAAAAIAAGNAMQESGFQPSIAGDASIPGGSHGYAQWNRDRFANLQGFAKQQGTDWTNPDTQIDFLANEAKDRVPEWSTQPDLSQARPISKAYEGYGIEGNRVPDASKFYDMYQSRPQPQQAQGAAPPPAQPQDATGGPLSEADPMTNTNQAKRGGLMRRKHLWGGGDGGDGGDGGGDGSGGDGDGNGGGNNGFGGNAGWGGDAAAAGFGGVGSPAGAPAGTSTNSGTTGFGGVGNGSSATGTSVGVNAPGNANANAGFGGVASPGNTGFGGGNAASATNSAPGGAGGVSTGAATGGGGGTASGGSSNGSGGGGTPNGVHGGISAASLMSSLNSDQLAQLAAARNSQMYGSVPAYYSAGFGLGPRGVGNPAAAQSDTATMRGLIGGVAPGIRGIGAGVAPGYGFATVKGNDPALMASNTAQNAVAQAQANGQMGITAQEAAAGVTSMAQVNALNAQLASLHAGNGNTGYGNAGFGGGSPGATVGGFGGNANSTGAEGVNTAALAPHNPVTSAQMEAQLGPAQEAQVAQMRAGVGVGSPSGPPGFAGGVNANAPSPNATNVMGVGTPPGVNSPAPAPSPAIAPSPAAHGNQERVQRGGYLHRASGGIASMPTDELIEMALTRIRQRRNAASGGSQNKNGSQGGISFAALAPPSPGGPSTQAQFAYNLGLGGIGPSSSYNPASAEGQAWTAQQNQQDSAAPAAAAPVANTPAIPGGAVGNHGGYGAVGSSGSSGSPISGVPNANSAPPPYNNTLDQVLGTNNPSMDQIFGFTYPTPPPPKPQPQGPVSQDTINALSMFGQGSQVFASGGAIIMDAALNKARKAIKAGRRS